LILNTSPLEEGGGVFETDNSPLALLPKRDNLFRVSGRLFKEGTKSNK
jgi:hypothetical protein